MFGKKPKNAWETIKDGWDRFSGQVRGAVMSGAREGAKLGVKQAVRLGVRDAVREGIVLEARRNEVPTEDALVSEAPPKPTRRAIREPA